MEDIEETAERLYQSAMAHAYQTERVANRGRVERLLLDIFGDDLPTPIVWADGPPAEPPEYWLGSDASRTWIDYYAAAADPAVSADMEPAMDADDAAAVKLAVAARELLDLGSLYLFYAGRTVCVDRPLIYSVDDRGDYHSSTGAALMWRDGQYALFWHGVGLPNLCVPGDVIEGIVTPRIDPAQITLSKIKNEPNQEVRRALIALYRGGEAAWLRDSGAEPIDRDDDVCAELYRLPDTSLVLVCWDGAAQLYGMPHPRYALRIDPQCRPLHADGSKGDSQKLTARAAVASTYGLTAAEYRGVSRT